MEACIQCCSINVFIFKSKSCFSIVLLFCGTFLLINYVVFLNLLFTREKYIYRLWIIFFFRNYKNSKWILRMKKNLLYWLDVSATIWITGGLITPSKSSKSIACFAYIHDLNIIYCLSSRFENYQLLTPLAIRHFSLW